MMYNGHFFYTATANPNADEDENYLKFNISDYNKDKNRTLLRINEGEQCNIIYPTQINDDVYLQFNENFFINKTKPEIMFKSNDNYYKLYVENDNLYFNGKKVMLESYFKYLCLCI